MNLFHAQKILEVGSGTGAVIEEIMSLTSNPELYALDINWIALQSNPCTNKILGKGEQLPFPDNFFDITLCHYLLLWIENPIEVLKEMNRVTRVGGWIACLAEPDYGGRIDYPYTEEWKSLLQRSLSANNPNIGRKLRYIFSKINLNPHVGIQSTVLSDEAQKNSLLTELRNLKRFISPEEYNLVQNLESQLLGNDMNNCFSFMPVFYSIARKRE